MTWKRTAILLLSCFSGTLAIKCPSETHAPAYGVWDPDRILSDDDRYSLEEWIDELSCNLCIDAATRKPEDKQNGPDCSKVQMTVAIVDHMNDSCFHSSDIDVSTELWARELHDTWGVGNPSPQGDTGILFFLALQERSVYISRGKALQKILNGNRIDSILTNIGSDLKTMNYAQAIKTAMSECVRYVEAGEPSFWGIFQWTNLWMFMHLLILPYTFIRNWLERRRQREYAIVASRLSDLDRAQAEALKGKYEIRSCPICLEAFRSSTVGSDGKLVKLLRCGHAFDDHCWNEWIRKGRGNVMQCPICKLDVCQPCDGQTTSEPAVSTTTGHYATPNTPSHSDIHPEEASPLDDSMSFSPAENPQVNDATIVNGDPNTQLSRQRERSAQEMQRFQQERNFRLQRLHYRFPRLISQSDVQRWSSSTQNGSLVRDPNFSRHEPNSTSRSQSSSGRSSSRNGSSISRSRTSFGGGRSSGGSGRRF